MKSGMLSAIALVLLAIPAYAETSGSGELSLDTVLAKHFAAQGGLERLKSVRSVSYTGTDTFDGKTTTVASTRVRPNLMRWETNDGGTIAVKAFDGKVGWYSKGDTAELIPAEKLPAMKSKAEFDDPIIDASARGHKVELLAGEKVDGAPCHVLKLTLATGDAQKRYIDAKSFLEVKRVATYTYEGKTVEKTMSFRDFKTVNGITTAMTTEFEKDGKRGTFAINKIEYNAPVKLSAFAPPKSAQKAVPTAAR